jgi:hypothetical protein
MAPPLSTPFFRTFCEKHNHPYGCGLSTCDAGGIRSWNRRSPSSEKPLQRPSSHRTSVACSWRQHWSEDKTHRLISTHQSRCGDRAPESVSRTCATRRRPKFRGILSRYPSHGRPGRRSGDRQGNWRRHLRRCRCETDGRRCGCGRCGRRGGNELEQGGSVASRRWRPLAR